MNIKIEVVATTEIDVTFKVTSFKRVRHQTLGWRALQSAADIHVIYASILESAEEFVLSSNMSKYATSEAANDQ